MKYFAILLALIATPLGAAGITSEALVLQAPDVCEIGELVTLDASASASPEVTWKVVRVDATLEECMDFKAFGKVACFSAREASMWLVIVSGVGPDNQPIMMTHSITVDGGVPGPGPGPSIESKIKQWSRLVESDNTREEAIKLAQSFRALAGAELPVDKVLEATALANKQALGTSLQAWMPFLDKLGTHLDELAANDGLSTRDDYQRTWNAIADGIERAFK